MFGYFVMWIFVIELSNINFSFLISNNWLGFVVILVGIDEIVFYILLVDEIFFLVRYGVIWVIYGYKLYMIWGICL